MSFYTSKNKIVLVFALMLVALGLNSCKKEEEKEYTDASYVRHVNASPTLGTYNIYFDDSKVNTSAIPFGGTVSYSPYAAGSHTVKYTTATNIQSLLTKSVTLEANKIQTLFLIGQANNLDALLVVDDATEAGAFSEKAFVKFINLSPDAPALSLEINGGASLYQNKAYKANSNYIEVEAKEYTFDIKDSATGAVKTSLPNLTLGKGRYYTIIARGMLNPGANEQPFSAQSIINL